MMRTPTFAANVLKAALLLSTLLMIYAAYTVTSDGCGGLFGPNPPRYNPPADIVWPGTPPPPSGGITPPGITAPGGPQTPGPAMPGGAATGPGTGGGGPRGIKGAQTKKSRPAATSSATWDYWWARNHFQYMELPDIFENAGLYPATPHAKASSAVVSALRGEIISLISPLLDGKSARLRRGALIGLARLNASESLADVTALLQDRNQTVRDAAVLALGLYSEGEAKHTLLHIAKGTEVACKSMGQSSVPDYIQEFALISLAMSGMQGVDAVLKSLALDSKCPPEIRAMAMEGLGLLGGEESAKILMDFVKSGKAPKELLASAVTALHKTKDPAVLPFLDKCLYSDCIPVRQSAALGLGYLVPPGDEEPVKKLFKCYKGTYDQALKGFCLVAMGQIGGSVAIQYLDHVVLKGQSADRAWACLGLGLALRGHDNEKGEEHLLSQLKGSGNRSIQGAAAIALGLVKSQPATEELIKMLRRGDDPVLRGYCALALGMIGDPAAATPLQRALGGDELPQVKTRAALALALMRNKSSVPDLVNLLLNTTSDVTKSFVSLSLSYMGEMNVIKDLLAPMQEAARDDLTRMYCVQLTTKLLSGWTKPYLERLAAGSNFACEYPVVAYLLEFGI